MRALDNDSPDLPAPIRNPAPTATPPKGWTALAWTIIILAVAGIMVYRNVPAPADADVAGDAGRGARLGMVMVELQGRYIVGAQSLLGAQVAGLYEQALALNRGSVDQRLRFVTLAGELAGAVEARHQLDKFDEACRQSQIPLTENQQRLRATLGRLYRDYDRGKFTAPSVTEAERRVLAEDLGWFGELALHPANTDDAAGREAVVWAALRTFLAVAGLAGAGSLATLAGFVGLVLFVAWSALGKVSWRVETGSPYGGVYAETFALWLVTYAGLLFAAPWLPFELPFLIQAGLLMILSTTVLGWPMLRGVPWRQLRADVGWTCANPFAEIAAGIACYIVNLPLVAIGLAITIALILLQGALAHGDAAGGSNDFSSGAGPVHPIVQFMTAGDWSSRVQIYLLASVIAPIVEETMFRGLLYRHCRELTGRFGRVISAGFGTVVVSFIFASIHPQGLVAIPPLMFIAYGLTLAREWRGSLLPGMFAHGMNNAVVTTVALIALSP